LGPSSQQVFFFFNSSAYAIDPSVPQAAQVVSASQDVLVDLFDRIENFFRRLEAYIEVSPTAGMADLIVKVMVEVLSILAISTKEVNQSGASESIPADGLSFLG
jgi:hypothetical protein